MANATGTRPMVIIRHLLPPKNLFRPSSILPSLARKADSLDRLGGGLRCEHWRQQDPIEGRGEQFGALLLGELSEPDGRWPPGHGLGKGQRQGLAHQPVV